jgi:hypothetical protein
MPVRKRISTSSHFPHNPYWDATSDEAIAPFHLLWGKRTLEDCTDNSIINGKDGRCDIAHLHKSVDTGIHEECSIAITLIRISEERVDQG